MRGEPAYITWRQYGGIVVLCALVGVLVGTPVYVAGLPLSAVAYLPIILMVACVIATSFALVAALFACVVLILIKKYELRRQPSFSHSITLGVLAGALIGAFHPFVIVYVIVARPWTDRTFAFDGLRLTAVVMISGAIAGGLIVRRYGPEILDAV